MDWDGVLIRLAVCEVKHRVMDASHIGAAPDECCFVAQREVPTGDITSEGPLRFLYRPPALGEFGAYERDSLGQQPP
jgi:hypothetical protein